MLDFYIKRQTLFAFEADATALVPEVFDLEFEDEYEELEADLQEFSEKFADSPAAQVCGRSPSMQRFPLWMRTCACVCVVIFKEKLERA